LPSQSEFRPAVYVVGWPDHGVLKIGSAFRPRRWKDVARHGGHLIGMTRTETYAEALQIESAARISLARRYECAFESREDAARVLPSGSGWTECFKVPQSEWEGIAQSSLSHRTSDDEAIAQSSQTIAVSATETATASEGRTPFGWSPSIHSSSYVMRGSRFGWMEAKS
jgi:hypothetical protein